DYEGEVLVSHAEGRQSVNDCASYCAGHDDDLLIAGTGFFGITKMDGRCWCSNDLGRVVSEDVCEQPVRCSAPHAPDDCLRHDYRWSDVYVFGPADK
ncbi:unnamed protein product, partial [Laminaria digitata]